MGYMKNNHKKKALVLLGSFLLIGLLFLISPVQAAGEWWAENVIGGIIRVLISAIGLVMVLVIKALVWIAQYNNFISSPPVEYSWTIVRDIANMFFVVVLLIIAFATILNQEKYSYKTWLPKVILMAVLINFSKTICGLMIDVAQVVMLTFVNAFKSMAAGNLVSNLGIIEVVTLANRSEDIGFWEIVGAYFLGLIYMIVALVVIVTMVAMLVMRMVMIWIYVALSPMAYLFSAFPGGQKYSSMWWSEFSKNLIVGPVLAFFIWLSFVSMQSFNPSDYQSIEDTTTSGVAGEILLNTTQERKGDTVSDTGAVTEAGKLDVFIKFIISIGMLIGGLKIASEIGGAAGKIAGSGMAKLQKGAAWTGSKVKGFAKERVKGVGKFAARNTIGAGGFVLSKIGKGLGENKAGKFFKQIGDTGTAWKNDLLSTKKENKEKKKLAFMEKIGMKENTLSKVDTLMQNDTTKNTSNVASGAVVGANVGAIVGGPIGMAVGGVVGAVVGKIPDWASRGSRKKIDEETTEANSYYNRADEKRAEREQLETSLTQLRENANPSQYRDQADQKTAQANILDSSIERLQLEAEEARRVGNNGAARAINEEVVQKKQQSDNLKNEAADLYNRADGEDSSISDVNERINLLTEEEQGLREQGDSHLEGAKMIKDNKWFKRWQSAQAFTTVTTQKAAARGSKEAKDVKDRVDVLSKDPNAMKGPDGFGNDIFYSKSGQTSRQKKLFSQLADKSNPDSITALDNMANWATAIDPNNEKEMAKAESLAKGIAAFAKGGGDTSSFGALIAALDAKNRSNPKSPVDSVEKLKEKVIANRKTGLVTEQGSGALHVNTFANNLRAKESGSDYQEGKDVIGIDFNKIADAGLDVKADASFVDGANLAPVVASLIREIDNAKNALAELHKNNEIDDKEFSAKTKDLDDTKNYLSNSNNLESVELVNTGSPNYIRKERMTSKYHEEIHRGGVEDEDLAERTAQSLMNNKLYGRNAKTGGRHATEIASFIKEKQSAGLDNDKIMQEVEVEIKRRLGEEGANRAARVIAMENNEKESETAYAESGSSSGENAAEKDKGMEIDTSAFEGAVNSLAEKIITITNNIPNNNKIGARSVGSTSAYGNILYPLNLIAKNIQKNSSILQKIQNFSGGRAPKTVIELTALSDAASVNNKGKS